MFGCLVAGRLVSAARAAGGALNPLGAGVELPRSSPFPSPGSPFPSPGSARGWPQARRGGGLAVLVTPARRLGWLLPLIPRGSCGVEPRCREAVAIPSLRGEAWAAQRQVASLKRSFLRLDCALAARMWHLG